MSSTNRSKSRSSHIFDYYTTPVNDIKLFLETFTAEESINWSKQIILDPCAGGDDRHSMSYPVALKEYGVDQCRTMDIREDSKAEFIGNYLESVLDYSPDIVITNPPFNISLDVIKKAISDVRSGGWVIMLLRLNYFGSKQRKEFWDKYMPQYAFVHHRRIGFTDNSRTDSVEYMHCCWKKDDYPVFCKLKVI